MLPRRRSRERLGRGLLKSRWGEAESGEVISLTVGSRILSGVIPGRFIYPPDFRVVQAKRAIWISIGCWNGMLWQRRGGEALGVLLQSTPGSRLDSWKVIGCWPRPGRFAGSPAGRISIEWQRRWGHEVSLAGRWIFIGCCRCSPLPSPTCPQASGKPRMSFWRRRGDGWCRSRRG